jgi:outer membrane biosynthesis protein TonB
MENRDRDMNRLCSTFVALWNKTKSLSPLVPLMLVSLLLALLLGGGNDLVGASSLFQSPPEPPTDTPTPTELPPTDTPPPTKPPPTDTPTPTEPTATPLPPKATAAVPAETPPEEPSEGSPSAPVETPTSPAEAPSEASEAAEPTPAAMEEPAEEAPPSEESSPLTFNWGVFLSTVIVTLSYAWIGCGVCGLVVTPLVFILFYVGGKRRLRQGLEESEEDVGQS